MLSDIWLKWAGSESSSCRFSFSVAKNANTKATAYVTFGFSFCILVFPLLRKFEPHCLSARRIFFSVLAAIIRESSEKLPCAENREG